MLIILALLLSKVLSEVKAGSVVRRHVSSSDHIFKQEYLKKPYVNFGQIFKYRIIECRKRMQRDIGKIEL